MKNVPLELMASAILRSGEGLSYVEPKSAAKAALTALEREGYVLVPKRALAWLNGEGPDRDGKWFGECEDAGAKPLAGKYPRRYWWRSKFSAMIAASSIAGREG